MHYNKSYDTKMKRNVSYTLDYGPFTFRSRGEGEGERDNERTIEHDRTLRDIFNTNRLMLLLLQLFLFFRNDNDGRENVTVSMQCPHELFSHARVLLKKSHDKIRYQMFKSGQKNIPHFARISFQSVFFIENNCLTKENTLVVISTFSGNYI
jgi:hypothetical protein